LRGVADLDPGSGEPIAQGVGEGPRTLFASLLAEFQECFDEGRDDIPGIPRTHHGELGQSRHHSAQHRPGSLDAVHLLGVGRPIDNCLLQLEDGGNCRRDVTVA